MLALGLARTEFPMFAFRAQFPPSRLTSLRYAHSTARPQSTSKISPLVRPFHDFFESPTDVSDVITRASFEPFATRGLPLLIGAKLVSEATSDTYEITEKGTAVLQELEKRMEAAKSAIDPWSNFFGANTRNIRGSHTTQPKGIDIFQGSRQSLKKLWTDLGTTVYEVEEPSYLRPAPTGIKHHLYVSTQDGSQSLLRCSSCSTTQVTPYALTRPASPPPTTTPSEPAHVDVSLTALRHPTCDIFYALVTRPGTIPHEDRIRAALLASHNPLPTVPQSLFSSRIIPTRILIDNAAGVALSGQSARLWFDRLRMSIEQGCPRVMDGRSAELDRYHGRVFVPTGPPYLVPHHGQAQRGFTKGFILGNFRTAGVTPEETCVSCLGPLESIKGSWVAKVAMSGKEDGEVTVRVLDPLPMLAALAATGALGS
ncbi:hypothetical protein BDV93DRAFT_543861 [Ceratobasidium sp. AG-I]|nr:hypothetical protein BDV93DRAFT_543861 [Ceratobasidium sp. AG-I]